MAKGTGASLKTLEAPVPLVLGLNSLSGSSSRGFIAAGLSMLAFEALPKAGFACPDGANLAGAGDLQCVGLGGMVSLGESGRSLGETTSLALRLYSETTELCTECASKLLKEPRELHRENIKGVFLDLVVFIKSNTLVGMTTDVSICTI